MVLRDHVSAIDELAMATERLRVRHPDEPKPNPPVLHIIEPHEVKYLTGKTSFFFLKESSLETVPQVCVCVCSERERSMYKFYNAPLFQFQNAWVE